MQRFSVSVVGTAVLYLCSTASGAGEAILLADNNQVLDSWQQMGGSTPTLTRQEDGETSIQWNGGVAVDAFNNSIKGNSMATPHQSGSFYKATVQGDLRAKQDTGELSYLQFVATSTDYPGAVSYAPGVQLNRIQMGYVGKTYQFAMGDVAAGFSTLGTNTGLRGLLGQAQFGKTLVSATAGAVADSWESLAGSINRLRPVRDVYAAKVEHAVSDQARIYATAQGYSDDTSGMAQGGTMLAPASGQVMTAGFSYQKDQFAVQGEAGGSSWKEQGRPEEGDRAFIVDASWNAQSGGIRVGHHDIGGYYSSLATQGGNGIRETYLNGNWLATDWMNLNADVRHSENALAGIVMIVTPPGKTSNNATKTDAATLGATFTFGPSYPGWSLMLNHGISQGETREGLSTENSNSSIMLSRSSVDWGANLGYSRGKIQNAVPVTDPPTPLTSNSNAETDTWQFSLNKTWTDQAVSGIPAWGITSTFGISRQEQKLDIGGGPTITTWQVGLNGQRLGLGTLSALYLDGTTSGQPGGNDIHQRTWLVEGVYPLKGSNAIKVYLRNNQTSGITTVPVGGNYEEKMIGVQFVYAL